MTALQGCVQAKGSGQSCVVSEIVNRVGVTTAGMTGDGRWTVTTTGSLAVFLDLAADFQRHHPGGRLRCRYGRAVAGHVPDHDRGFPPVQLEQQHAALGSGPPASPR